MERMRKQNNVHIGEKSCGYPKNLYTLEKKIQTSLKMKKKNELVKLLSP